MQLEPLPLPAVAILGTLGARWGPDVLDATDLRPSSLVEARMAQMAPAAACPLFISDTKPKSVPPPIL